MNKIKAWRLAYRVALSIVKTEQANAFLYHVRFAKRKSQPYPGYE